MTNVNEVIVVGTDSFVNMNERTFKVFQGDDVEKAEAFFKRLIKDQNLSEDEIEICVMNGYYECEDGDIVFMIYRNIEPKAWT